ncbi:MAG: hypothetical protein ACK5P5_03125 [Pseudobdellovibrionaceae bacterium]
MFELLMIVFLSLPSVSSNDESAKTFAIKKHNQKVSNVTVSIQWKYKNFPLEMMLYHPATSFQGKFVGRTGVVGSMKKAKLGEQIQGEIQVARDSSFSAVLVVKNTTKQDVYFFAVPHEVSPIEASLGHQFFCLCKNLVFKVPPGKVWYRVVNLEISPEFMNIDKFKIEHQIIGISRVEALTQYKNLLFDKR